MGLKYFNSATILASLFIYQQTRVSEMAQNLSSPIMKKTLKLHCIKVLKGIQEVETSRLLLGCQKICEHISGKPDSQSLDSQRSLSSGCNVRQEIIKKDPHKSAPTSKKDFQLSPAINAVKRRHLCHSSSADFGKFWLPSGLVPVLEQEKLRILQDFTISRYC